MGLIPKSGFIDTRRTKGTVVVLVVVVVVVVKFHGLLQHNYNIQQLVVSLHLSK